MSRRDELDLGYDISQMKAFEDETLTVEVDTSNWTTEQWAAILGGVPIIRCKDCKHFELDHFENVSGVPLIVGHEICTKWGGGCKTDTNGYCFMAKRKEEE